MIVGLRHAAVENPERLVYARLPGFHLSEEGLAATRSLAASLGSTKLSAVYASPLERAAETAAILASPHGLEVRTDDRLLEWSFWVRWQGLPWSRVRERDPDLLRTYGEDPELASPEDPLRNAGERILEWAAEAEARHPQGLVIGVTHEAPLLAALLIGSGRQISDYHSFNLPHLGCVRLRPGPAEVVEVADLVRWARTC